MLSQWLSTLVNSLSGHGVRDDLEILVGSLVLNFQSIGPGPQTVGEARFGHEFREPLRFGDPIGNTT